MENEETAQTERRLSLDEMLKLAEHVESWEYSPTRLTGVFGPIIPEHYIGETNRISIEVGQRAATPWGGWLRYIEASYGNLILGKYPKGLEQNDKLDTLFYSIQKKIRKRGLDIVNRINESSE